MLPHFQYDDKGNYLKANKINKIKLIPSEKNFTIIQGKKVQFTSL